MSNREFDSVLVANRGEIACRILRAARAQGLRAIAVFSEADRDAPHVALADEAVAIGAAPAAESYLSIVNILAAARQSSARAIHPGYGFLSERAEFARAVEAAGLVFIGPSAQSIAAMGDKAEAKRAMLAVGVPCAPGYEGDDQTDGKFVVEGERIGYPVMAKASAGGGGRGMRLVARPEELRDALARARSEAAKAFGSDRLILEKAILGARHVEIQIFGDTHGHIVSLGERDCSVQRRHQKVIEEAPSPAVTPALRAAMAAAAVEAARAVDYVGAGTVEFLLDQSGAFYFLEMNTRLQVEHPVTEMVTGLDLVALQFAVARGEPLPEGLEALAPSGHAIEARLYAEDPTLDFLPALGRIDLWSEASGEGIRVDAGVASGQTISPYYDAMLAKIVAHGPTREIARRRLIGAIERSVALGVTTNAEFLVDALGRPAFAEGRATTGFVGETYPAGFASRPADSAEIAVAAAIALTLQTRDALAASTLPDDSLIAFASAAPLPARLELAEGERVHRIAAVAKRRGWLVNIGAARHEIDELVLNKPSAELTCDGAKRHVVFHRRPDGALALAFGARRWLFTPALPYARAASPAASGRVVAPMPGVVVSVSVSVGQPVKPGDPILVLEAMKMQHTVYAPVAGRVREISAAVGKSLAIGATVAEIDEQQPVTLAEALDFRDESRALGRLLEGLAPDDFERRTGFKNWSIDDVLVHLHFWNRAVDLSLRDEAAFRTMLEPLMVALKRGSLRAYENNAIAERGPALASAWLGLVEEIAERWSRVDPKVRLPWVGPSMSVRSAMTARQMETWAHGFEIFDLFGETRVEQDRLRNIVMLGVNTFGWSHQVHGLAPPPVMPELTLTAPSGAVWTFGDRSAGRIRGPAADFASVVTQTRALADTALVVEGEVANTWMRHAQCFAGPPETPPAPGSRRRQAKGLS